MKIFHIYLFLQTICWSTDSKPVQIYVEPCNHPGLKRHFNTPKGVSSDDESPDGCGKGTVIKNDVPQLDPTVGYAQNENLNRIGIDNPSEAVHVNPFAPSLGNVGNTKEIFSEKNKESQESHPNEMMVHHGKGVNFHGGMINMDEEGHLSRGSHSEEEAVNDARFGVAGGICILYYTSGNYRLRSQGTALF